MSPRRASRKDHSLSVSSKRRSGRDGGASARSRSRLVRERLDGVRTQADKYASIPMGFSYEKEAVGEAPVLAEEFAPAVKRTPAH